MKTFALPEVRSGAAYARRPSEARWSRGDVVQTRFLDAMSAVLPAYEHFFIAVINAARADLGDARLKEEAKAFCAQEGQHASAHRRYNEALWARPGYARAQRIEQRLRQLLRALPGRWPRSWLLAIAAGGEHLTSFVAHEYLANPERWSHGADPAHDAMFRWHAGEEIEHKAVCFDVTEQLAPSLLRRRAALLLVTLPTVALVVALQLEMLRADGELGRVGEILAFHLGRHGILRGLVPELVDYLAADFHPWNKDDRELLHRAFAERV